MEMENFLNRIDIGICAIAVIICSLTKFLPLNAYFPFMYENENLNYGLLCWILLTAITIHLLISIGKKGITKQDLEKHFEYTTETIIKSLNGVKKQTFQDTKEASEYCEKRIAEAQTSVYDFNWIIPTKLSEQDADIINMRYARNKEFHAKLSEHIKKFDKSYKSCFYREIFVFHNLHKVNIMNERLKYNKYSCKYYKNDIQFPKMQFVIIDNEEVIFLSTIYKDGALCAIKDPKIVKLCTSYFDVAWENAIPIKVDDNRNETVIKEINNLFN
jgi:hypothetical protein